MENEKACPLRTAAGVGAAAERAAQGIMMVQPGWGVCLGTACAWYDAAGDCCAVLALVRGLRNIGK